MGCSRVAGLIIAHLVADLVGLTARLLSALLHFLLSLLVPLVARLLLFIVAWMMLSLTALPSPRRSADAIADRMVDRLLQAGFWIATNFTFHRFLRGLVLLGFVVGWALDVFILIELVQWIF